MPVPVRNDTRTSGSTLYERGRQAAAQAFWRSGLRAHRDEGSRHEERLQRLLRHGQVDDATDRPADGLVHGVADDADSPSGTSSVIVSVRPTGFRPGKNRSTNASLTTMTVWAPAPSRSSMARPRAPACRTPRTTQVRSVQPATPGYRRRRRAARRGRQANTGRVYASPLGRRRAGDPPPPHPSNRGSAQCCRVPAAAGESPRASLHGLSSAPPVNRRARGPYVSSIRGKIPVRTGAV